MKTFVFIILLFLFNGAVLCAQEKKFYEEEGIGIRFLADGQWRQISAGNCRVLELVNQNNNLNITMWHKNSKLSASDFLSQLIDSEGILTETAPFETLVDGCKAIAVTGICNEMHRPVRVVAIVIPDQEGFNLVKFKCPDECFREHRGQIDKLISSIHLGSRTESLMYYASWSMSS